jgi:hypothetical protein
MRLFQTQKSRKIKIVAVVYGHGGAICGFEV